MLSSGRWRRCLNFNPRPPRGGRRGKMLYATGTFTHFNPRPPRGGRRSVPAGIVVTASISIHALREEGDRRCSGRPCTLHNFNPRPPRGERHVRLKKGVSPQPISIHALREESDRPLSRARPCSVSISIHALREESDLKKTVNDLSRLVISIHALREESDRNRRHRAHGDRRFQSTPSARRAT